MISKETFELVTTLLEQTNSCLEATTPQIERTIQLVDKLVNGGIATKFRDEQSARNAGNSKRRVRDRIELVKEAMAAGISEETALKILFSVYSDEPDKDSLEIASDAVSKLSIPNLMNLAAHKQPATYPFPGAVPSAEAAMYGGGFPSEEADVAEESQPEE